jgi:thioredoxin 2
MISTRTNSSIATCEHCAAKVRVPVSSGGHPRCPRCHRDLPWLVDVGDADFESAVINAALPVLVDCWATWCGPCVSFAPVVAQVARERAGRLKVVKVDVDTAPIISQRFAVRSIPTVLLFQNGELVDQRAGASSFASLDQWLRTALPLG